MKKIVTIVILMFLAPSLYSQIKIDRTVEKEEVKECFIKPKLDSTVDLYAYKKAEQFLGLIGQKVYARHLNRSYNTAYLTLSKIRWKNRLKKIKINGIKYKYGEFIALRNSKEGLDLYEKYIEDKYFKVDSVKFYKGSKIVTADKFDDKVVGDVDIYLSNKNDNIRVIHNSFYFKYFLSVPYFEYLKNKYEGKRFLNNEEGRYSLDESRYSLNVPKTSYFRPASILEKDILVADEVKLKKINDTSSEFEFDFELKAYFKNKNNEIISFGELNLGGNCMKMLCLKLVDLSKYEELITKYGVRASLPTYEERLAEAEKLEQQQKEEKERRLQQQKAERVKERKKNLKKFGKYYGKLINEGKVIVGMSAKMCRAAWGEPDHINRTVTKYSISEQWVYDSGNYLYFENGKLTAIQN